MWDLIVSVPDHCLSFNFASNVQLGYVLTRSGGQAVQGSLSCRPPPTQNFREKG